METGNEILCCCWVAGPRWSGRSLGGAGFNQRPKVAKTQTCVQLRGKPFQDNGTNSEAVHRLGASGPVTLTRFWEQRAEEGEIWGAAHQLGRAPWLHEAGQPR